MNSRTHYKMDAAGCVFRFYVASDRSVWDVTRSHPMVITELPDLVTPVISGPTHHEIARSVEALVEDPTIHHSSIHDLNHFNYLRGRGLHVVSAISRNNIERGKVPRGADYALLRDDVLVGTVSTSPGGLVIVMTSGDEFPRKLGKGRRPPTPDSKRKYTISLTDAEFLILDPALEKIGLERSRMRLGSSLRVGGNIYPRNTSDHDESLGNQT